MHAHIKEQSQIESLIPHDNYHHCVSKSIAAYQSYHLHILHELSFDAVTMASPICENDIVDKIS